MPTSAFPPEAEEEIRKIVNNPDEKHAGYWINRRYFFFGAALKTCLLSKLEPSTFSAQTWEVRKNYRSFHRQRRSRNPRACCGKGTTGKLTSIMDHHAFPTIDSFVEKHNRYSNWEAIIESTAKDDDTALQHEAVKGKRKLRRIFRQLPLSPYPSFPLCISLARWHLGRLARLCLC